MSAIYSRTVEVDIEVDVYRVTCDVCGSEMIFSYEVDCDGDIVVDAKCEHCEDRVEELESELEELKELLKNVNSME